MLLKVYQIFLHISIIQRFLTPPCTSQSNAISSYPNFFTYSTPSFSFKENTFRTITFCHIRHLFSDFTISNIPMMPLSYPDTFKPSFPEGLKTMPFFRCFVHPPFIPFYITSNISAFLLRPKFSQMSIEFPRPLTAFSS